MKIAVLDRQQEERARTTALIACRYKSNPVEVSDLTSYRIQVAHYLTKPISKEKINEALRRIKKTGGIFYEQN